MNPIKADGKIIQNHLRKRAEILSDKIDKMSYRIYKLKVEDSLVEKLANGKKIDEYAWTYKRAFKSRRCFTTGKLILPGAKAYKGTKTDICDEDHHSEFLPVEMWLTKEEFTLRRLQGQI